MISMKEFISIKEEYDILEYLSLFKQTNEEKTGFLKYIKDYFNGNKKKNDNIEPSDLLIHIF